MNQLKYVLITAARNEATHIDRTIQSVIGQTQLPERWVVVSDGSTDPTDTIVAQYASEYPFLHFLRIEGQESRNFGSKVNAFLSGYATLESQPYDLIGNLDADVCFEPAYFQTLCQRFQEEPFLGIAGGHVYDWIHETPHKILYSLTSVCGAVQLFRRSCYEAIGGLQPISIGGEDTIAEVNARRLGWKTRTFEDLQVIHLRPTGTHNRSVLSARFRQGIQDGHLGYSPTFYFARCLYRLLESPVLLGSLFRLLGYGKSKFETPPKGVSQDFLCYLRQEQHRRLKFWKGAHDHEA